jgi:hypothetical protein
MQQLLSNNLWAVVSKMSKAAKRIQAALAYVSTIENLHLQKGDTLIVDESANAIKSGQTSANVLKHLHGCGVILRSCPQLHAKTIVLDDKAIVGSGNCSQSSAVTLVEAAILTDDPILVSQAKSFIYQLAENSTPIDAAMLQVLTKIKVIRRGWAVGKQRTAKKVSILGGTTWITCVHELAEDAFPKEQKLVQKAESEVKKLHPKAEPCWIRFAGSARIRTKAHNGDMLIVATAQKSNGVPHEVEPPTSLLKKQDAGRWTRFYYDSDLSAPLETISWNQFQKLLKSVGVRADIGKNSTRAISVSETLELQRIWPRIKRPRKR